MEQDKNRSAIAIFHTGYLSDVLPKAALFAAANGGPSTDILIISDARNNYDKLIPGFVHICYEDMVSKSKDILKKFDKVFKNDGPNPDYFEKLCFERFILLNELMKCLPYHRVLHIDADVFLFDDISFYLNNQSDKAIFLNDHSTFFSSWTPSSINQFVDFVMNRFFSEKINDRYCDMSAINKFLDVFPEICDIQLDNNWIYKNYLRKDLSFRELFVELCNIEYLSEAYKNNPESLPIIEYDKIANVGKFIQSNPTNIPFVHLQGDMKNYSDYFCQLKGLNGIFRRLFINRIR